MENDLIQRLRTRNGRPDGFGLGPVCDEAADEIARLLVALENAQRLVGMLRHERDRARARNEWAAQVLSGIHALLYPAPIKTADGRTMVFRPKDPDPHTILQKLSDRIRALPDELAAMKDTP